MKSIYATVILPVGILIGTGCYTYLAESSFSHSLDYGLNRENIVEQRAGIADTVKMNALPITQTSPRVEGPWVEKTVTQLTQWGIYCIGKSLY